MKIKEPDFRCGTKKAIEELVAEYKYPYEEGMQDWSYEIADPKKIKEYFKHYDEQTDEDKKFSLMEMLIQAITDTNNKSEFEKYWNKLKELLIKDFELHEYTIFYWSCLGENLTDCWKITKNMRNFLFEIKSNR